MQNALYYYEKPPGNIIDRRWWNERERERLYYNEKPVGDIFDKCWEREKERKRDREGMFCVLILLKKVISDFVA